MHQWSVINVDCSSPLTAVVYSHTYRTVRIPCFTMTVKFTIYRKVYRNVNRKDKSNLYRKWLVARVVGSITFKSVRMHTVCLPMCSTVAPMARGGRGDITGNVPGQGFTSPSPCTHGQGAYGAPTGAVGGAADGRRARTNAPAVRQRLGVVSTDCMAALRGMC